MNNYIQIYKNVIEPEYCDEIVKKHIKEEEIRLGYYSDREHR
tara:strand:- start:1241 stop:1366 length:126 start_codon:yes stop_codon:yes gene_type:complete